jgi:hypothetical protein
MTEFLQLKNRINLLGRAEYRYDRLVSDFSEHYLELVRSGYEPIPDLKAFHSWLKHLNFEIRPSLLECWKEVAHHKKFELGDLIEVEGTKIYAVRADSYPDLDYIRFTGYGVKKDEKPGQTSVSVNIKETTAVTRFSKKLEESILTPIFFEGSCRLSNVREFLNNELSKLASQETHAQLVDLYR